MTATQGHYLKQILYTYIIAKMRSLPDPAGGLTAPPRPPAVLHAASGSVGLGHRGSHSPREKPPTKVLHQAPHIGNPALDIVKDVVTPYTHISEASRYILYTIILTFDGICTIS